MQARAALRRMERCRWASIVWKAVDILVMDGRCSSSPSLDQARDACQARPASEPAATAHAILAADREAVISWKATHFERVYTWAKAEVAGRGPNVAERWGPRFCKLAGWIAARSRSAIASVELASGIDPFKAGCGICNATTRDLPRIVEGHSATTLLS